MRAKMSRAGGGAGGEGHRLPTVIMGVARPAPVPPPGGAERLVGREADGSDHGERRGHLTPSSPPSLPPSWTFLVISRLFNECPI